MARLLTFSNARGTTVVLSPSHQRISGRQGIGGLKESRNRRYYDFRKPRKIRVRRLFIQKLQDNSGEAHSIRARIAGQREKAQRAK